MINRTYFFAALLLLILAGCSSNDTARGTTHSYCEKDPFDPNNREIHPSNDPATMSTGDLSMSVGCFIGVQEELDELGLDP